MTVRGGVPTAIAFVLAIVLVPAARVWLLRHNILDVPNHRSSHDRAVARGAGVALVVAALAAILVDTNGLLAFVALALFGGIGFAEDIRGVGSAQRFVLHVVAAMVAVTALLVVNPVPSPLVLLASLFVVFIVGYVNAFNFMDGINGISALTGAAIGVVWALQAAVLTSTTIGAAAGILVGASLGFLPFNFPKAAVFMGDAGAYFLGAWIGLTAVAALLAGFPLEVIAAPVAFGIADTSTTVVRRAANGERWYEAHNDHTYQRMVRRGWSHTRMSLTFAAACLGAGLLAIVAARQSPWLRIALDLVIVVSLVGYLRLPTFAGGSSPASAT